MYNIPILLVFFNREDVVMRTFERIRDVQPSKLYLACDGPRENCPGERLVVEALRERLLKQIDWPCDVRTRFLEKNVGCSLGVSTAIDWLFENEEVGIVLEDDCVAQKSFFAFAEEMLLRFAEDQRIGLVAGYNPIEKRCDIAGSYCFSRYKSTWGWASWRRVWQNMDLKMSWREDPMGESIIKNMGYEGVDVRYWKYRLKAIDRQFVSAWDWQFFFSQAAQNQLTIYPKVSLISNIGFGEGATHTAFNVNTGKYKATQELEFPLRHPRYVVPDFDFDRCFYRNNNTLYNRINQLIPFGLKREIKRFLTSRK